MNWRDGVKQIFYLEYLKRTEVLKENYGRS